MTTPQDDSTVAKHGTSRRGRRRRGIIGPVAKGMGLLLFTGVVAFAGAVAWVAAEVGVEADGEVPRRPAVLFVAADGEPVARKGDYRDLPVTRDEVPENLVQAVMAIEDRRFYDHFGFDPLGILRAARANYQEGTIVEGASTLTQQLAKRVYLTHDRTYTRKIKEILLAVWLEYQLDKDEILVRYLDSAYYGNGVNGLRAAARHYYGKEVSELEVAESAMLAGMLRAPSYYAPTVNPAAAKARARQVVQAMQEAGYISEEEARRVEPALPRGLRAALPAGSYFSDWVMSTMDDRMASMDGEVRLHTSLDSRLQQAAEAAVREILAAEGESRNVTQAALVAMRPDGQVVAMVGGRDYRESTFNRAVQAKRQPGSAFKLFAYLAAMRYGATGDTRVIDEPIDINGWKPENYGGRFSGAMSVEQAFARSVNTVAVRLSETVGPSEVVRAARDLGIESEIAPLHSTPLGTQGVSLLELTSAYAAVARGAYPVRASGLPYDVDNVARRRLPQREELHRLLRAVVTSGTGTGARLPIETAGKTGTSQDYRDAWFIGYAGNLVTGVWVGNDDDSPMKNVTGGSLPTSIWKSFMTAALQGKAIDEAPRDEMMPMNPDERHAGLDGPDEALFAQKAAAATAATVARSDDKARRAPTRAASSNRATSVAAYAPPRQRRVEPRYPFRNSRATVSRGTSPASPGYRGGATRTYK